MQALLAKGLVNAHGKTIAPRLVTERGEIIVAEALPRDPNAPLTTAGQRVTYIAQQLSDRGCFDCEVCADGTIIPSTTPREPSLAVRELFAARGWSV